MEKLDSYRLEKMVIPRQSGRTTNMINDAINLSISKFFPYLVNHPPIYWVFFNLLFTSATFLTI